MIRKQHRTRRIYVASYAPALDQASMGGVLWWAAWADAVRDVAALLSEPGAEACDYRIVTLDLPATMTDADIDAFLCGDGDEVVTPPDPSEALSDALALWRAKRLLTTRSPDSFFVPVPKRGGAS